MNKERKAKELLKVSPVHNFTTSHLKLSRTFAFFRYFCNSLVPREPACQRLSEIKTENKMLVNLEIHSFKHIL